MIFENDAVKAFRSRAYNFNFDKKTGFFARWGETEDHDPDFSKFGPEIVDLEATTICNGPAGKICSFCYKSNTKNGDNMSFETFVDIFHKLPRTISQIAFGTDATLTSNPDIWKIFDYCRENDYNKVVPNVTVANIDDATAQRLAGVCGAVAVSLYSNKDWCYDSIQRLVRAGMTQCNAHAMLSEETYDQAVQMIRDYHTDPRLKGMNAIVLLSLKQVGRGVKYHRLSDERFKSLIDLALELDVKFGFDSCSAPKFIRAVADHPNLDQFNKCAEPCESTCFSLYVNRLGIAFPCSFSENEEEGIDLTKITDFNSEVWHADQTWGFRNRLLENKDGGGNRSCPLFEI